MGKPKKGKRGDVSDDDESLTTVDAVPASKKAEKKKKGKKGRGDDSDSEAENVAEDAPAAKKKEKKKDKKKGKKKLDSDDESGDEDVVQTKLSKAMKNVKISDGEEDEEPAPKVPQPAKRTAGPKSAFSMLTSMDSDVDAGESDDTGAESDDHKPELQPAPKQKAKEKKQPKEQEPKEVETGKKGKKNKGGKKEEDLDELFAEFGIEVKEKESKKKKKKKKKGEEDEDEAGAEDKPEEPTTEQLIESKEAKVVAPEDLLSDEEEESRKDRRKKKKGKQKEGKVEPAAEDEEKAEEGEDEDGGVKTAAQKRKEKKERERLKKLEEKQKAADKAQPGAPKTEPPNAEEVPKKQDVEVAADEAPKEDGAAEEEQKDDKKSKKDKKKKDKDKKAAAEEDDKKKKGPSKKVLIAMQEQLKKIQEQEETARRAEEERIRREEEAEEARLEKVRLEKERKEREKAKKKDRITRQKQKGTYLTPKQKEQRARAQAMLEMLKAQGAMIPALSKDAKLDEDDEQEDEDLEDDTSSQASATAKSVSAKAPAPQADKAGEGDAAPKVDAIKESWDEGEDEVKDSWEDVAAEIVPAEKPEEPVAKQAKLAPKEEPAEAEESSEESESEEESSEESESETESEESDEEESKKTDAERRFDRALARIEKRRRENEAKRSTDVLRQPVVCVLGHVDTGKTKILDKLRRTNVQEGEAGGITQQIGATNVPLTAIEEQCKMVHEFDPKTLKIPGLLIIDTPGHESFSNLRSRGSSLCDIAVLVVDIMHGLEPQTIESINLLKKGKTPFIIALNKIDRLYDWKSNRHKDVRDVINAQAMNTRLEFQKRTQEVIVGMAEQGLNAALFFENPDPRTYLSMIPTSAVNGDGMGNLMGMLVNLTQNMLAKRIAFSDELQATVLEVKAIAGLGTTVDVILVNGTLREGDTMIIAGTEGPIATQIRSLLMPQPMKELRVKNSYKEYKEVRAAQGVKVCAKDLEKTIAGLNLLVANSPDEVEVCKKEVARELKKVLSAIKLQDRGVYVIASTLGSLEALLEFLKGSQIPYSGIRIGPVAKRDVMRASVQLEHDSQYAVILAFDVKVEREAQELADSLRVRIFRADIIYHLFDQFMAYREDLRQKRRRENEHLAVFPCKLRILPQFIFNTRDPIVVGVSIEAGLLKVGTPLCVPSKEFVDIGVVTSIEINNKQMEVPAKKGQEVCIKIENRSGDAPRMFGRHFEASDTIVSRITRESIDACKEFFRDDLGKPDWQLMIELKKQFQIL